MRATGWGWLVPALVVGCSKSPPPRVDAVTDLQISGTGSATPPLVSASAARETPSRGACKEVATSAVSRYGSTGTVLADGRVLLVGSAIHDAQGPYSPVVEVFDPQTKTVTKVASSQVGRAKHAAARLADGRVLVVGGMTDEPKPKLVTFSTSAAVYDVAANKWTAAGAIPDGAIAQALTALPDGRAILAGGDLMYKGMKLAQVVAFEPRTLRWSKLPDAPVARAGELVPLGNGRLVFAGDNSGWSGEPLPGAEVLDPSGAGTWSQVSPPLPGASVDAVVRVSPSKLAVHGRELVDGGVKERLGLTDAVLGAVSEIPPPRDPKQGSGSIFAVDGILYLQADSDILRFDEARRAWFNAASTRADGCSTRIVLPGRHGAVLFAGRCLASEGVLELCELAP